jgi:hypothetical protein
MYRMADELKWHSNAAKIWLVLAFAAGGRLLKKSLARPPRYVGKISDVNWLDQLLIAEAR